MSVFLTLMKSVEWVINVAVGQNFSWSEGLVNIEPAIFNGLWSGAWEGGVGGEGGEGGEGGQGGRVNQNFLERKHFVFTSWLIHAGDFDLFLINKGDQ